MDFQIHDLCVVDEQDRASTRNAPMPKARGSHHCQAAPAGVAPPAPPRQRRRRGANPPPPDHGARRCRPAPYCHAWRVVYCLPLVPTLQYCWRWGERTPPSVVACLVSGAPAVSEPHGQPALQRQAANHGRLGRLPRSVVSTPWPSVPSGRLVVATATPDGRRHRLRCRGGRDLLRRPDQCLGTRRGRGGERAW